MAIDRWHLMPALAASMLAASCSAPSSDQPSDQAAVDVQGAAMPDCKAVNKDPGEYTASEARLCKTWKSKQDTTKYPGY